MKTDFGILIAEESPTQINLDLEDTTIVIIRAPVFLSSNISSPVANAHIFNGFNVCLNLNYKSNAAGANAYPSDMVAYKSLVRQCLEYYADFKDQISFVTCENEYDSPLYHTDEPVVYADLFANFLDVVAEYDDGFKVSEAGITSTSVRRWMYSRLTGDDAIWWRAHYFTGLSNNYDGFIKSINDALDMLKTLNYNFANLHWYNDYNCPGSFKLAAETYAEASGRGKAITNEFGIKTASMDLWQATLKEIKDNARFAVAYSGVNAQGKAIKLTQQMLKEMQ